MSESFTNANRAELAEDDHERVRSQPVAIGILATEEGEDRLHRTVLQSIRDGFAVFIVPWGISADTEAAIDQTDATIVEPADCGSVDDARERLVEAARTAGASGIALCEAGDDVNLEACHEAVHSAPGYAISAPTQGETGRLVGIPAYNESVGIGSTIIAAQEYADEVVVVDDGSADDTASIARGTDATVLEHDENRGKGSALYTFFEYARASDADSVIVLDGDGQHVPNDIPKVTEPIEDGEADLVVGSRYLEGSGGETPFYRRFGQQVLDILTFGSSGTRLSDTQSGFRAFSPEAVDTLSIRTDGMGVESELIGTAMDADLKIEEVPIDVRYEGIDGQTYNPVRHGLGVATYLIQLIRDRHPLLFFGVPGLVLTLAGLALGVDVAATYNAQGAIAPGRTLIALFLTIVGVLGVFCGLILNRMSAMLSELRSEP